MASYNLTKPPCGKVCDRRAVGCRGSCEAWAAYEAKKQEEYKLRQMIKEISEPGPGKTVCMKARQARRKRGRK